MRPGDRRTSRRATGRRVVALALALVALATGGAGLGSWPAGPAAVLAAPPDLTFVTATTYEVRPDEGRVAVTVRITATNRLKDTTTRRYFFEQGFLSVLPGTSNFAITGDAGAPTVAVSSRSEAGTVLRIRFGTRIAAGKSLALSLTFDLVDPGGAPDRPVRISPTVVRFPAWAYGTAETPGSSVEVVIPAAYDVEVGRGPLNGPTANADGAQVFASGSLDAPLSFVADISADRPVEYVDGRRSTRVGDDVVLLVIQAWPDDEAWRDEVGELLLDGLPALGAEIGLPWPFRQPLTVTETLTRGSGYIGVFDPGASQIQVSYLADPEVVLHEAAHGWFNGRLVADRWIAEAFASYYAERAAAALEIEITPPDLAEVPTDEPLPLNAWPPLGEASRDDDDYGFAASLVLAREIAATVGDEVLRAAWAAAAEGRGAYQPDVDGPGAGAGPAGAGAAETGAPPVDWRSLLDLLTDLAAKAEAGPSAPTDPDAGPGEALEALWRRWVLRPDDVALLEARAEARAAYAAAVEAAAPWQLPRSIREAMRAWQFEAARALIADAEAVLRQRAAIEAEAAADGLTPPEALELAFEGDAGLPAAAAEAAAELAAIGQIRAAEDARIAEPGIIDRLGLIGTDPAADLEAARAAFEAGEQDEAVAAAATAEAAWEAVPDVARGRIISGVLLALAALLLVSLVTQRRRRPRAEAG